IPDERRACLAKAAECARMSELAEHPEPRNFWRRLEEDWRRIADQHWYAANVEVFLQGSESPSLVRYLVSTMARRGRSVRRLLKKLRRRALRRTARALRSAPLLWQTHLEVGF